jgi:hypothetical protein
VVDTAAVRNAQELVYSFDHLLHTMSMNPDAWTVGAKEEAERGRRLAMELLERLREGR